jgi:hypothetical protein
MFNPFGVYSKKTVDYVFDLRTENNDIAKTPDGKVIEKPHLPGVCGELFMWMIMDVYPDMRFWGPPRAASRNEDADGDNSIDSVAFDVKGRTYRHRDLLVNACKLNKPHPPIYAAVRCHPKYEGGEFLGFFPAYLILSDPVHDYTSDERLIQNGLEKPCYIVNNEYLMEWEEAVKLANETRNP